MTDQADLKKTPLFEEHFALKARLIPFGGWLMPVQYEGILAEYESARNAVALFDTSHMGEFVIEGDCLKSRLDYLLTQSIDEMPLKTGRYGFLLNSQGGVIDDLIVFREDLKKWFIVVNGATTTKDAEHFRKSLSEGAVFKDISLQTGKLDIQGPKAREVLKSFLDDIEKLDYFTFDYFDLLGNNVLISRTGYTGELGYEIFCPWVKTKDLWQAFLENKKVKPAGLGARDVLRCEMGYSLYGHELNEQITPIECGLSRFIDLKKDFLGKEALLKQKDIKGKAIGMVSITRRSPRAEQKIYSKDGQKIGVVTSGTFSPYLKKGIGLGYLSQQGYPKGESILFGDDDAKHEAVISERVFYKNGSLKN